MSIVFPQPMGELIRACSCSFLVKQEPFHCINIKSRDSSSIRYWKLFRCSILRTGVDFFKIGIDLLSKRKEYTSLILMSFMGTI